MMGCGVCGKDYDGRSQFCRECRYELRAAALGAARRAGNGQIALSLLAFAHDLLPSKRGTK